MRTSIEADTEQTLWLGFRRKWWVVVAIGLGAFMTARDASAVSAVVPIVMQSLAVDFATAEWITMIYLVVVSGLLLTFGRLGDMLGHKRVHMAGCAVFTVGSALCGLAPDAVLLIAARGVQAVGAAMIFGNSAAIITHAFPARQRGQAIGLGGTAAYLGLVAGPTSGGYLAERFGWQAIFFVSLPLGLITLMLAFGAIAPPRPVAKGERFDPIGSGTFVAGLCALLLALSHGQSWGWSSAVVLSLLGGALVLLVIFVRVERSFEHPMFDLTLLSNRTFTVATVSALLNYMCVYAVMFLLPFYLIQYRGFEPAQAGLLIGAQAIAMPIVAPLSGILSDRIGTRLFSALGMGIVTAGLLGLALIGADTDDTGIVLRLVLLGLGSALFVAPNNSAILGAAPRNRQGVASAVIGAARNVGMVLGVAVGGAIFASALVAYGGVLGPDPGFLPAFRVTFVLVALLGFAGTLTSLLQREESADN